MGTTTEIRSTANFALVKTGNQYRLRCKLDHHYPRSRRISASDAEYLQGLSVEPKSHSTFDSAAVIDFGVGVFQTP